VLFVANAKGRNFSRTFGQLAGGDFARSIKIGEMARRNGRIRRLVSGPQFWIS
jgi:hypothetical protein